MCFQTRPRSFDKDHQPLLFSCCLCRSLIPARCLLNQVTLFSSFVYNDGDVPINFPVQTRFNKTFPHPHHPAKLESRSSTSSLPKGPLNEWWLWRGDSPERVRQHPTCMVSSVIWPRKTRQPFH